MTLIQKLGMALAYKQMTQAALAKELGTSAANVSQRFKRGTFSVEDLEKIARAMGAKFEYSFVFEDGTRV